jgi:hypothetical protein
MELDDLLPDLEQLLLILQQMAEITDQQNASLKSLQPSTILFWLSEMPLQFVERDAAQAEIEKLRLLILRLQRGRFGRRSEKLDPDQLQLGLEDLEQTAAPPRRRRRKWPRGTARLGRPLSPDATWAACRPICRGSRCWSTSRTRAAPAAAGPCTRSARTRARCSTSSPPSCG